MARRHCFALDNALRVVLTLLYFAGIAESAWAQFETRATHSLPGETSGVALGDFNGDGKLDVAATAGESLVILLGNGDGTFRAGATYPGVFYSIVAADFNNDGILDLIVSPGSNNVEVFLGNGDGTFQPPKVSATTDGAAFIAVGDFNGDHKLDIAIVDHPYVSILLGNGDGTFQLPTDNESFVGPQALAVGDFNNDHRLDVVVVGSFGGSANVGVLLGNGDGTLQPALAYPLNSTPYSVAAADFDHDGNLDVAVGYEFGDIAVLLGKGDGSFQPEVDYFTSGGAGEVSVADFNGDGKPDLAFSESIPAGLNELLGNGDGTFQNAQFFPAGRLGGALGIGDLNGDHKPDVVYVDRSSGATTLLNTGALSFSPSTPLNFPTAQLVGTTSTEQVLTLTNEGTRTLSIRSIATTGVFHANSICGSEILPASHCDVSVVFEPKLAGMQRGFVSLYDGASSKVQVVELTGRGTVVALSPRRMSFAPQKVGTQSPPRGLLIKNTGSVALTISKISVGGEYPGAFSVSGETDCTAGSLIPGASCKVNIVFTPRKQGALRALVFVDDSGAGSPETAALAGTGD